MEGPVHSSRNACISTQNLRLRLSLRLAFPLALRVRICSASIDVRAILARRLAKCAGPKQSDVLRCIVPRANTQDHVRLSHLFSAADECLRHPGWRVAGCHTLALTLKLDSAQILLLLLVSWHLAVEGVREVLPSFFHAKLATEL